MSMDVAIWVTCLASVPADLPESNSWNTENWEDFVSYVYPSPNMDWQLILEKLDDTESPTEQALTLIPDIKHGYVLSLEPLGADELGYKMLDESIQFLANKCGGAVVEGPAGVQKVEPKT
jgi:hypothetical protein